MAFDIQMIKRVYENLESRVKLTKKILKRPLTSSEKNYLNDSYKSFFEDSLSVKDPELYKAIKNELIRQQQHIELIASENIVSQAVLEAQGSVLTNKYA